MATNPALSAFQALAPIYDDFCASNDYENWLGGSLLPALEKYGLQQGNLLDVGCGTGRAFEPMLARGWRIVGCDLSPAMLAEAKRKFGKAVPLHVADVRNLPTFGKFELVWALNDVVNYLLDDGDLIRAFAGMRANLAPGGFVLFDTNTLATMRSSSEAEAAVHREKWLWEGLSKHVAPGATFDSRISGPGVATHIHRERHYTARQIAEGLEAVGLRLIATLGQQEVEGDILLRDATDDEEDHKVIHICKASHD